MIIKIHRSGRSFAGVSRYLMHDVDKKSSERVAWTHTLNLTEDEHIPTAVHEMVWTYRAADALKRQAGVATGGDKVQKPVKHFTLAWHESTRPTKEHMIETVRDYLKHMGWGDRQAILIAHRDKRHPHVHVVLNCISPEDGRTINTYQEYVRSEAFGLRYEREQDRIFCEQRLKNRAEREGSINRPMWERMKGAEQAFDRDEAARAPKEMDYFARGDQADAKDKEWELLKSHQKDERLKRVVQGKQAFRTARAAVFREVRTEFRAKWKAYFEAQRQGAGAEQLAGLKQEILTEQNAVFDARKELAFAQLKAQRSDENVEFLKQQKEQREELRSRQAQGLRSYALFDEAYPRHSPEENTRPGTVADRDELKDQFRRTGEEVCETGNDRIGAREHRTADSPEPLPDSNGARVKSGVDITSSLGLGALGGLAAIGERLFDGFFGQDTSPRPRAQPTARKPEEPRREEVHAMPDPRVEAARDADAVKLQAYWEERRGRKRERD